VRLLLDERRDLAKEAALAVGSVQLGAEPSRTRTGCAYNFERGGLGVSQSLLHKPMGGPSGLPPTRASWYTGSGVG
jgi:hypothetical protein